jgi:hypothetical protein
MKHELDSLNAGDKIFLGDEKSLQETYEKTGKYNKRIYTIESSKKIKIDNFDGKYLFYLFEVENEESERRLLLVKYLDARDKNEKASYDILLLHMQPDLQPKNKMAGVLEESDDNFQFLFEEPDGDAWMKDASLLEYAKEITALSFNINGEDIDAAYEIINLGMLVGETDRSYFNVVEYKSKNDKLDSVGKSRMFVFEEIQKDNKKPERGGLITIAFGFIITESDVEFADVVK